MKIKAARMKLIEVLVFSVVINSFLVADCVLGADNFENENLFSPSVSEVFYKTGRQISGKSDITGPEAEKALLFYQAAINLDSSGDRILGEMVHLIASTSIEDHRELVFEILDLYVDENCDLYAGREGIDYILRQLNTRQEREDALKRLAIQIGGENNWLNSDIMAMLGLLSYEKGDLDSASGYFLKSYDLNSYNLRAFEKILELAGDQVPDISILQYLRNRLRMNPYDLQNGLEFSRGCEKSGLFELAAESYGYCADLYNYLEPDKNLIAGIYLPWSISCYNTERSKYKCVEIAQKIRKQGTIDPVLEAIAYKAARSISDGEEAEKILSLIKGLEGNYEKSGSADDFVRLAWFYCFGTESKDESLSWANKAYSIDPNSENAVRILSYALVRNEQYDLAKELIKDAEENQLSAIAMAEILKADGNDKGAIDLLKGAIEKDPASLESQKARELLSSLGSDYIFAADRKILLGALDGFFGKHTAPKFTAGHEAVKVSLDTKGGKFSYGNEIAASVVIKNNSSEPVIISDESFVKGNIRIDVKVSGDIETSINKLVELKIRPSEQLETGRSLVIPVELNCGELNTLLAKHPQASLKMEFSLYLDSIDSGEGFYVSQTSPEPARIEIERTAERINTKYLQNRLDSLSSGHAGQKIKVGYLFAGLLAEQQEFAGREPLYKIAYAGWMREVLKSAILNNLVEGDWTIAVHTLDGLDILKPDYDLTAGAASKLYDDKWPVRLSALYFLSKNQDSSFSKVAEWVAEHDKSKFVRDMAEALKK
ncbi:MAG: hypothetical protein ISS77_02625 [Phycisphaerae bacterium]|nr:hypothetical protein [Phycisphaerae bacterium]